MCLHEKKALNIASKVFRVVSKGGVSYYFLLIEILEKLWKVSENKLKNFSFSTFFFSYFMVMKVEKAFSKIKQTQNKRRKSCRKE